MALLESGKIPGSLIKFGMGSDFDKLPDSIKKKIEAGTYRPSDIAASWSTMTKEQRERVEKEGFKYIPGSSTPATSTGPTRAGGIPLSSSGSSNNLSKVSFDKMFNNTPLQGQYDTVVKHAQAAGLSPALVAGIMAHETGRGSNVKGNNPAGIMDPATGWSRKMQFGSIEDGINKAVSTIAKNYNAVGGDLQRLALKYAPPGAANDPGGLNAGWLRGVLGFQNQLAGAGVRNFGDDIAPFGGVGKQSYDTIPNTTMLGLTKKEQSALDASKPRGMWDQIKQGLGISPHVTPDGDKIPGVVGRLMGQQVEPAEKDPLPGWKAITPSAEEKKETADVWGKVDEQKKDGKFPIVGGDVAKPIEHAKGYGSLGNDGRVNTTHHPEQQHAAPGSDGYGAQHNNDNIGLCTI
jgi:hypothetical protein